jgi:hypothetical protein
VTIPTVNSCRRSCAMSSDIGWSVTERAWHLMDTTPAGAFDPPARPGLRPHTGPTRCAAGMSDRRGR